MNRIITGDALAGLKTLPDKAADTCVTSPPYYGLRDYGMEGQIGLEDSPQAYIDKLVSVFHEVRRVLKPDGTLWIVIADSYAGSGKGAWRNPKVRKETYVLDPESAPAKMPKVFPQIKPKDLIGIPWMLAFALRADGWYLRQDIIWQKPNAMPESVRDRCTKSYEHIFLLSKSPRYYFDGEAISEPCVGNGRRNKRDVWTVSTKGYNGAHFATYPPKLIEPCILAGSRVGGTVLDPFLGSGTTAEAAQRLKRDCIGIELNPEYIELIKERVKFN